MSDRPAPSSAPPAKEAQVVDRLDVAAYTVPTDEPETDGTFAWDATPLVVVHAHAGGQVGLGYTYGPKAVATLIHEQLADVVRAQRVAAIPAAWDAMHHSLRNAGQPGVGMMAIAAVDMALWDLKARLLGVSLSVLLGTVRDRVPVYGSGGFCSYHRNRLQRQFGDWVEQGIGMVKMKVGRDPSDDLKRVAAAREVIGPDTELFVDANGAYERKQALSLAWRFAEDWQVTWFEEPRPSDDLPGLRLLRDEGPPGMAVAAGEYGDGLRYFQCMLDAEAVDCLQADATRCGGLTGFLKVAALCEAHRMPLSAHTAPAVHAHVCCAAAPVRHVEYFHDHVRIEQLLFDGAPPLHDGMLQPDPARLGNGLTFKQANAAAYAA